MMNEIKLAGVLIAKRREMGITQDDLAAHVGVGKAAVSKWENGNSFPDITLLPVIASYFGISIDQLMDYSPQLSKLEIKNIYVQLATGFASESFEDVIAKCKGLVKQYYSCYPFLLQVALLYLNHAQMAATDERKTQILKSAIVLCERIINYSRESDLAREAASYQAMCHIAIGEPAKALEILGDGTKPPVLYGTLISQAYQMLGNVEKAKEVTQIELYLSIMSVFGGLMSYIQLNINDFEIARAAFERAEDLSKSFNMNWLNPNNVAMMYVIGSSIYQTAGKSKEAIEMLDKYVDVCMHEFFPFTPRGDAFFDRINEWLTEYSGNMPRDEAVIKESMLNDVMLNPMFDSLRDFPKFIELVSKLKNFVGGKENA